MFKMQLLAFLSQYILLRHNPLTIARPYVEDMVHLNTIGCIKFDRYQTKVSITPPGEEPINVYMMLLQMQFMHQLILHGSQLNKLCGVLTIYGGKKPDTLLISKAKINVYKFGPVILECYFIDTRRIRS